MDHYIPISMLNDFVFCPYSIYLHNSYYGKDEDTFHSGYQQKGKFAHRSIDSDTYTTHASDITSLEVLSEKYGLMGKIDLFKVKDKELIERKRTIKTIYQGYTYQLYAQYFCLTEMGFEVEHLAFYSMSDNKKHVLALPTEEDEEAFGAFVDKVRNFNPSGDITINPNKCLMCIYNSLCDKTTIYD